MNINELQVRLLHAAKTKDQWKVVTSYPKKGEVCLEAITSSGATSFKIKIGDGTRPYCRNTGTSESPVWDFTSDQVLPYFGTTVVTNGSVNVAHLESYTEGSYVKKKLAFYSLSLDASTTEGETTLSPVLSASPYLEIKEGTGITFTTDSEGNVSILNINVNSTYITNAIDTAIQALSTESPLNLAEWNSSTSTLSLYSLSETNGIISKSSSAIATIDLSGIAPVQDVQISSTSILSDGVADIAVDGTYDATNNKIATESTVSDAIEGLDVTGYEQAEIDTTTTGQTTLTIKGIKEDDGEIVADSTNDVDVVIDGTYNASTNKIATQSTVTNAVKKAADSTANYDTTASEISQDWIDVVEANEIEQNDTFEADIDKLDTKIAGLADELIKDEQVTQQAISSIANSVGLENDLTLDLSGTDIIGSDTDVKSALVDLAEAIGDAGQVDDVQINGASIVDSSKNANIAVDGTYNSSTNKIATESTVNSAIDDLDVTGYGQVTVDTTTTGQTTFTIKGIKEEDGKIAADSTQDVNIVMDGTYNASTNKIATESTVSDAVDTAIGSLDAATVGGTDKVITTISETDGVISATAVNKTDVAPVQGVTTTDTGDSGIEITTSNNVKDVHHKTVVQDDTDTSSIIGEKELPVITGVSVDSYGHITGVTKDISSNLIAADIKAPVKQTDNTTWNHRITGGDISIGEDIAKIPVLKGNTIVWNQLVDSSATSITLVSGNKYYTVIDGTKSIQTGAGTDITVTGGTDMVINLTKMFGSGKEPSTVEAFEKLFPNNYYEYNEGELVSLGGYNEPDEELWVDMGLPSGTLWAKSNIDVTQPNGFAASPYQYGCTMFSWGNTEGHNTPASGTIFDYNWGGANAQEPWYEGQPYGSTKGNILQKDIPEGKDFDAARANLGNLWREPKVAEFKELFDNCDFIDANGNVIPASTADKRVTVNGILGLYLQSKTNGNRLFFSASGYGDGSSWSNRGANGYYWSASFSSSRYARYMRFNNGGVYPQYNDYRYYGFAVRPVIKKQDKFGVKSIGFNQYNNGTASVLKGESYYIGGIYTSLAYSDGTSITVTNRIFTATKNDTITITGGSTDTIINISDPVKNGTYEPYKQDTLDLSWVKDIKDTNDNQLFPYGLLKAGSVYDEVTESKAVKRITSRAYQSGDESDSTVITDGTTTYYPLTVPIEVDIYPAKNMSYLVNDLGNETQLPVNPVSTPITAPFVGTFEYKSNFKDTVIDLIDKVNNAANPVKGINNTDQTVGKIAVYDSERTTHSSNYSASNATIVEGATGNDIILPAVETIVNYVNTKLSSALTYKGTISEWSDLPTSGQSTGDMYIADTTFTESGVTYQAGDFFIWNGTDWDIVSGTTSVVNSNPTLSLDGGTYQVGTVDGIALQVTTPNLDYSSPTASGTSLEYIDSVSQSNGLISATKKSLPNASTTQAGVTSFVTDIHYSTDNEKTATAKQIWVECEKRNVQFVEAGVVPTGLPMTEDEFINTYAYGVKWVQGSSECTRVGNSSLHETMPIHNALRACVYQIVPQEVTVTETIDGVDYTLNYGAKREFRYWLDDDDWNKKADGTPSVLTGEDMTGIAIWHPKFYGKSFDGVVDGSTSYNSVYVSLVQYDNTWTEIKEGYVDFAKMQTVSSNGVNYARSFGNPDFSVDNPSTTEMTLSAINTWIQTQKDSTQSLIKSQVNMNRLTANQYAMNAGAHLMSLDEYKWIFCWLPVIECAAFTVEENTHFDWQDGSDTNIVMRDSLSNVPSWMYYGMYSANYSAITGTCGWAFVPAGYTNKLGTHTGWIKMRFPNSGGTYDSKIASRWRGFEIQRNIWTNLMGVNPVQTNTSGTVDVYSTKNRALWNNNMPIDITDESASTHANIMPWDSRDAEEPEYITLTGWEHKGIQKWSGYGTEFDLGSDGNPTYRTLGSSKPDYHYGAMSSANPRCFVAGGRADRASYGGPFDFNSSNSAGVTGVSVGFRCCWNIDEYNSVLN